MGTEEQQIQVNDPRTFALSANTPHLAFNSQESLKQVRCRPNSATIQKNNLVGEPRLISNILRFRIVHRGTGSELDIVQSAHGVPGSFQIVFQVSKVGAEADKRWYIPGGGMGRGQELVPDAVRGKGKAEPRPPPSVRGYSLAIRPKASRKRSSPTVRAIRK